MRLYAELADWFHLLTHPSDYEGEAADYTASIQAAVPGARTLLELGCGGGNNASHMKRHFTCTLTDRSPDMLAVSRSINPECEHLLGDMRSLRLGRTFDAVFVHDAVAYMTTLPDLAATAETAFIHTRPGGVAVFVPDATVETFRPGTDHGGHDSDDGRALRYLEWTMQPAPGATSYDIHFAILLRERDGSVRVEYDLHPVGLFTRQQWFEILGSAGFTVSTPPIDAGLHETQTMFACRRQP